MRALIVEPGRARGALTAARALHAAGWTVGVGTPTSRGLASASRATTRSHPVPAPEVDLDAFVEGVNTAIRKGGYEVAFGAGDAEAIGLSARRGDVRAIVPYAAHEAVVRAHDKLQLGRTARAVGLATPHTLEMTEGELNTLPPPCLVKAAFHAPRLGTRGPARLNPVIAYDSAAAAKRAAEIRAAGSIPLRQEFVAGELMSYAVVRDFAGNFVADVAQVADRTWPPSAGVSSRACTVEVSPELTEGVAKLLSDLGWFGLAQLQFILPPDAEPRLIDFNGRFYGSLALAVGAGVNLPAIWAALATDRPPPALGHATLGVRYQWLEADLWRAVAERRGGLLRDVASCLRFSRGAVQSVWSARDPGPSLHHLGMFSRRFANRALARREA